MKIEWDLGQSGVKIDDSRPPQKAPVSSGGYEDSFNKILKDEITKKEDLKKDLLDKDAQDKQNLDDYNKAEQKEKEAKELLNHNAPVIPVFIPMPVENKMPDENNENTDMNIDGLDAVENQDAPKLSNDDTSFDTQLLNQPIQANGLKTQSTDEIPENIPIVKTETVDETVNIPVQQTNDDSEIIQIAPQMTKTQEEPLSANIPSPVIKTDDAAGENLQPKALNKPVVNTEILNKPVTDKAPQIQQPTDAPKRQTENNIESDGNQDVQPYTQEIVEPNIPLQNPKSTEKVIPLNIDNKQAIKQTDTKDTDNIITDIHTMGEIKPSKSPQVVQVKTDNNTKNQTETPKDQKAESLSGDKVKPEVHNLFESELTVETTVEPSETVTITSKPTIVKHDSQIDELINNIDIDETAPKLKDTPVKPDVIASQPVNLQPNQIIQAINDGVPIHYSEIPSVVQEFIATNLNNPGELLKLNITLRPENLGQVNMNISLTEDKHINLAIETITASAQKILDTYFSDIRQVAAANGFALKDFSIKVNPALSSQNKDNGTDTKFNKKEISDRRSKRRKPSEDFTIDNVGI